MATKPIDPLIDQMVAEQQVIEAVNEAEQPSNLTDPVTGDLFADEQREETEVAISLPMGGLVKPAVKDTPDLSKGRPDLRQRPKMEADANNVPDASAPTPDPAAANVNPGAGKEGQELSVDELGSMTDEQIAQYQKNLKDTDTTGRPSEVGGGRLSPETIVTDKDFTDHLVAMTALVKEDLKTRKIADIFADALTRGWTQKDLDKLLKDPTLGTEDEVATQVLIRMQSADKVREVAARYREALKAGEPPISLKVEYQRALDYDYAIAQAFQGKKSTWGRTGGVLNHTVDPTMKNVDDHFQAIINRKGGDFRLRMMAYLDELRPAKSQKEHEWRIKIASAGEGLKSKLYYHYYAAMLSSPDTLQRILGGNVLFTSLRAIERPVAAGIGKVTSLYSPKEWGEGVTFREAALTWATAPKAFLDGLVNGTKAFWHNKQYIGSRRAESAVGTTNPFDTPWVEGDSTLVNIFRQAQRLYGMTVSIPHRGIMGADEIFKASSMRTELTSLAYRDANMAYKAMIKNGTPEAVARKDAEELFQSLIQFPSEDMWNQAIRLAEDVTLAGKLEGSWGKFEDFLNTVPGFRIVNAFIRAPLNGAIKAGEYIPVAGLGISKRMRDDFMGRNGKAAHDIAVSRQVMGTGILAGIANYTMDNKSDPLTSTDNDWGFTGALAYSREERSVRLGRNEQPFSVWYKRSTFTDEELAQIKDMPGVVLTEDRVYKSYLGYEPVGAIVAVAATAAEHMSVNDDQEYNDKLAYDLSLWLGEQLGKTGDMASGVAEGSAYYAADLPMLTGFGEFFKAVMYREKEESVTEALGGEAVRAVANFGILSTPVVGWNAAAQSYFTRYSDPAKYESQGLDLPGGMFWEDTPYAEMPPVLRSIMDEIGQHAQSNPVLGWYFDEAGKHPRYNLITGLTIEEQGTEVERALASNTMIENTDNAFKTLLESHVGQPRVPKKVDDVFMNTQQRSEWAYAYSNMPIMDEEGSAIYGTVRDELRKLWTDPDWRERISLPGGYVSDDKMEEYDEARARVQEILAAAKNSANYYIKNKYPVMGARTQKQKRDDYLRKSRTQRRQAN